MSRKMTHKELRGLSPGANCTERAPLVGEVSANFCGHRVPRGLTDAHGRILRFVDRNRYFFVQVVPQLYSRG
jgi:hypothetical protein